MIPRMAHSSDIWIYCNFNNDECIFGRKDLRLIAIAIASVFSHMSFDIFLSGTTEFPFFVPFILENFTFSGTSWILFEFLAACNNFCCINYCFSENKKL